MVEVGALLLIAFFIGYIVGKNNGRQSGYQAGMAIVPIMLRQRLLEQGVCEVCRSLFPERYDPQ